MRHFKSRMALLLAVFALLAGACSDDDDGSDAGTEASDAEGSDAGDEAAAPEPPEEELVLTIGVPGDLETLDPCCANFIRSHEALLMMYEAPVFDPTV